MLLVQTDLFELERCRRQANPEEHPSSFEERTFSDAYHGACPSANWSATSGLVVGYSDDADGWWFADGKSVESVLIRSWLRGD